MNISNVMSQQNDRYRLGDLPFILLGRLPLQNLHAVPDHVHDVPFAAPGISVTISLWRYYWNVSVVKPVVRRRSLVQIMCWRIRSPEISQLPVNVPVRRVMK